MSTSLLSKAKRPLSPPPKDTTIRRVRQRVGSSATIQTSAKPTPARKRDESPEEGEVEEDDPLSAQATVSAPSISREDEMAAPSANGTFASNQDDANKDTNSTAEKPKRVAFPFKSRAAKVQAIPTVDMDNGPPARPIPPSSTISPTKGDHARSSGGSQNGAAGWDSYIPSQSRGGDSYVPLRDRERTSPKRSWSPPRRGDDADVHRRARSKSPVEGWDTYITPKYQDPEGRMRGGRLMDTYVGPNERESDRPAWGRSPPRAGSGDIYRPHPHSPPPRDRSPFARSDRYSPGPAPHRLPPRPPSPDRYFSSRHDERPWDYSSRDQEWDRGRYPPTRSPPLDSTRLPDDTMEPGSIEMNGPQRPPVMFSRHGDGAAMLLQQQQSLSQPLSSRLDAAPGAKPQAVYTRQDSAPVAPHVSDPIVSGLNKQDKPKTSKHKVAQVRSKEEERAAYGREFVGSGRINEYTMMNKLGEGTFGEVHRAQRNDAPPNSQYVALKRIIMHSEKDGMPITALREIKILKALNHPNIVKVLDIVVQPRNPTTAGSVYMVFPYMDHDLAGLLDNKTVQLAQSHIKVYMKQLLEGLEYMHENHIIHRDIKAANILISNEGVLQIADFGLARAYTKKSKKERIEEGKKSGRADKYTNCVVTRWYRPPELLLGERLYGAEIDLWGVGCILAEMFVRRPVFQGQSDMDQLEKIWWLCGTPTKETWPDFENLPGLDGVKEFRPRPKGLNDFLRRYDSITREACDLIDSLLSLDPSKRPTAPAALLHDYFWTMPLPADPKTMPKYEASHELDRRRKEAPPPPAPPPNAHQHSYQFPHGHGGGQFNHRGRGMGRGGGPYQQHQQRSFHPGGQPFHQGPPGPMPMGMGPMPPGLPMHPGMHGGLPPPPPPVNGLPPPRGFRPPPPPRPPHPGQQPPYAGNHAGRPPGPPGPPPGMPPRDRGPPPPNDSVVLHYG